MGKGDKYRPVDREKYDRNYDRIFGGEQPPETIPRSEHPATPIRYWIKRFLPGSVSLFDLLERDNASLS